MLQRESGKWHSPLAHKGASGTGGGTTIAHTLEHALGVPAAGQVAFVAFDFMEGRDEAFFDVLDKAGAKAKAAG